MRRPDGPGGLRRVHPVPSDCRPAWSVGLRGAVTALSPAVDGVVAGTGRGDVVWLNNGRQSACIAAHKGRVSGVAVTEAGVVSAGEDGWVRVWGEAGPRATLELGGPARSLSAGSDGVWVGAEDGAVLWWHPRAEVESRLLGHAAPVTAVVAVRGGSVTGDAAGTLRTWSGSRGEVVATGAPVIAVARQGLHQVVARSDGTVTVHFGEALVAQRSMQGVTGLAVDGEVVWTAHGRVLRGWSVSELQPIGVFPGAPAAVTALAAADGTVWAGGSDGRLCAWREPWPVARPVLGHAGAVRSVTFGPGLLASGGRDGLLHVWDPSTGAVLCSHQAHEGGVEGVSTQLGELATAGADGRVCVWTVSGLVHGFRASAAPLSAVCLIGDRVVSAGHDGAVHVHERSTGQRVHQLEGHGARVRSLARHPSGLVGSVGYDGVLAVWDVVAGRAMGHVSAHLGPVIALCAVGEGWATASLDGTVALWDPASTRIRTLEAHPGGAVGVAPLGTEELVTVGLDGQVRVWSLSSGECLFEQAVEGVPTSVAAADERVAVGTRAGDLYTLSRLQG